MLAYTDEVRRETGAGIQGFFTGQALHWTPGQQMEPWRARSGGVRWIPNGVVCAVADGLSANMGGIGAAGNAVVPQIPELIGRAVLRVLTEQAITPAQSFSLQSGHALSHKLASRFPSHSQIASSGLKP
jgi:hypothetical protein